MDRSFVSLDVTYDLRKKDLSNNQDKNLSNIFSKWTHYKHPQGYNLIVEDFKKMSLSNVTLNELNFKRFFDIILKNFSINSKDDNACQQLDKIKKEDLSNGTYFYIVIYYVITNLSTHQMIKIYDMFQIKKY